MPESVLTCHNGKMEVTIRELAGQSGLTPPMTAYQISALLTIAGIEPSAHRITGSRGRPPRLYDQAAFMAAHAAEAARTVKQFTDSDWLASAMLARGFVTASTEAGELWLSDGTRAEELHDGYGWVQVGGCSVAAHRVIWIAAEGQVPYGLQVNHLNGLRWDNRRANLELVTIGNNIRHAHGKPYMAHHDAVRELAELREAGPVPPDPYGGEFFTGGRLLAGPKSRRAGH
jgi:hypothetical protein